MQYLVDTDRLYKFNAWSGAKARLDSLVKHPAAYDFLESYLNEWVDMATEPWTETDINDFLWFDSDDILKRAGFLDENYNWTDKAD